MTRRPGAWLLALLWLHQVAIAWLSPLSTEDWTAAIDGPAWPTLGALYHWLIVESRIAHVVLTPLVAVALPLGLATLARGRRIRIDDTGDAVLVAVIASALWLAVPQLGLAYAYRLAVAYHVVGVTAALWYVIGFRAAVARTEGGATIGTRGIAGLAIAGAIAGATTRPVAIATLVTCALIGAGAPRGRRGWAIAGTAGLAVGAALAWLSDLDTLREHFRHDIDAGLHDFSVWMRVPAWLGAGTLVLWLIVTAWRRWRRREPVAFDDGDAIALGRGVAFAVATAAIALITTDVASFDTVAPGAAIAVCTAIVLVRLAGTGRARLALIVVALLVQARVITGSIRALAEARRTFTTRMTVLEHAPRGSVATVAPYPRHARTWFLGEDFRLSLLRDRVATLRFGLRGIALAPARREFQDVPALALHHAVDGDVRGLPEFYSADLATAREQFAAAIERRPVAARLVADGLTVPDRPGAPVLAAWSNGRRAGWWKLEERDPDREGQVRLAPGGDGLDATRDITAMWAFDLATGAAEPLARADDGDFRLRPARRMSAGVVACSAARCGLVAVIGVN